MKQISENNISLTLASKTNEEKYNYVQYCIHYKKQTKTTMNSNILSTVCIETDVYVCLSPFVLCCGRHTDNFLHSDEDIIPEQDGYFNIDLIDLLTCPMPKQTCN